MKRDVNDSSRLLVIGASAGGVDALLRIASGLSSHLAAPIVLVLHIGTHPSQMPELLTARGPNRAVFARTGTVPIAGMIYVAPTDEHVLMEDGVMRPSRGPKEHHARPAINPLFRSAALDRGPRVVGVILTGMLDDGAAGLQAIKACGGIAVVQPPVTEVMPEARQSMCGCPKPTSGRSSSRQAARREGAVPIGHSERIFMVDHHAYRLAFAKETYDVIPINFDDMEDPAEFIIEQTDFRGVDASIDAVGFEAKGSMLETVLTDLKLEGSSGKALRQAIAATRRGGVVSVPGVYAGFIHGFLFGDAFEKGLNFASGQTHAQRYLPELLAHIEEGRISPEVIISHHLPLSEVVRGYEVFEKKQEACRKVVLTPDGPALAAHPGRP